MCIRDRITSGKCLIAAANPDLMESYIEKDDIVILGNRYESQLCAIAVSYTHLDVYKRQAANSTARARKSRKRLFVLWSFFNIVFATLLDNDFSVCLLWLWQTLMEIPDSTQAPILAMR